MIRGIYISNTGLNAAQHTMDTISHNIANANTAGYKAHKNSYQTFKEALLTANGKRKIGSVSHGVKADQTKTDFSMGDFQETGNKFDYAIAGDAFFVLQTPDGFRYTRNGAFQKDRNGYLVDKAGNRVLGVSGAIRVDNGKIDQNFRLVSFQNKEELKKTSVGLFEASPQAGIFQASEAQVLQGYLETSNVNLVSNLTEMLESAKLFSFNSRVLHVEDDILSKTVNEVGTIK